jgi:putative oxidoreductase
MKYLYLTAFSLLIFLPLLVSAQTDFNVQQVEASIKSTGKYAVLVNTVQHFKAAVITGKELKSKHESIEFHVVLCGSVVKELSEKTELKQLFIDASKQDLTLLVCGMTLRNLKISADTLPKDATITDNGLIYTFGLQELGFRVITL